MDCSSEELVDLLNGNWGPKHSNIIEEEESDEYAAKTIDSEGREVTCMDTLRAFEARCIPTMRSVPEDSIISTYDRLGGQRAFSFYGKIIESATQYYPYIVAGPQLERYDTMFLRFSLIPGLKHVTFLDCLYLEHFDPIFVSSVISHLVTLTGSFASPGEILEALVLIETAVSQLRFGSPAEAIAMVPFREGLAIMDEEVRRFCYNNLGSASFPDYCFVDFLDHGIECDLKTGCVHGAGFSNFLAECGIS